MCAGIWSVTRRGRRSRSTVAQPGLCEREGKKKKEKREKVVLHLLEENIKQPLRCSASPPPPLRGPPARVYFHARPLHFSTSSRLSTSSLKRGQDSLKRSTHRSSTHGSHQVGGRERKLEPPPLPLYLLNLLPLSSMLASIRARLKRKLQRRRGRSTSGSGE